MFIFETSLLVLTFKLIYFKLNCNNLNYKKPFKQFNKL